MIRELRLCDIPTCLKIIESNWSKVVADRAAIEMRHAFDNSMEWPPVYYVYEKDGAVVGFAGMIPSWIMHGVYDFIWINVCKDHQKSGIGDALTKHRIDEVRSRGGKVINLMTQKYAFFAKHGFRALNTYGTREPWILMSLSLGELTLDKDNSQV